MIFREIASFEVVHERRAWPWIAFAGSGDCLAFASPPDGVIATRRIEGAEVTVGRSFSLAGDFALGAFSISSDREAPLVAIAGTVDGAHLLAILDPRGERKRVRIDVLVGDGHEVHAIAFDRSGRRVWLSLENATETVIALLDVASLGVIGLVRSAGFPRPALHELHLHPSDDAVLLLATAGDDGTFARVVGFAGDEVSAIAGALDSGAVAAGFVGFSRDGARVHLAEADEIRTHAWPALREISAVPFADEFRSSFSGVVLGDEVLVDGEDAESGDDAIMLFDRSALHGVVLPPPAPIGMWAGRFGARAIVTIPSKGDPGLARVLLRTADGPTARGARHLLS